VIGVSGKRNSRAHELAAAAAAQQQQRQQATTSRGVEAPRKTTRTTGRTRTDLGKGGMRIGMPYQIGAESYSLYDDLDLAGYYIPGHDAEAPCYLGSVAATFQSSGSSEGVGLLPRAPRNENWRVRRGVLGGGGVAPGFHSAGNPGARLRPGDDGKCLMARGHENQVVHGLDGGLRTAPHGHGSGTSPQGYAGKTTTTLVLPRPPRRAPSLASTPSRSRYSMGDGNARAIAGTGDFMNVTAVYALFTHAGVCIGKANVVRRHGTGHWQRVKQHMTAIFYHENHEGWKPR